MKNKHNVNDVDKKNYYYMVLGNKCPGFVPGPTAVKRSNRLIRHGQTRGILDAVSRLEEKRDFCSIPGSK